MLQTRPSFFQTILSTLGALYIVFITLIIIFLLGSLSYVTDYIQNEYKIYQYHRINLINNGEILGREDVFFIGNIRDSNNTWTMHRDLIRNHNDNYICVEHFIESDKAINRTYTYISYKNFMLAIDDVIPDIFFNCHECNFYP